MYQVQDTVLYGSDGLCRIDEIVTKDFCGTPADYYVLKPIHHESSTIYVPMKNETLVHKMRRILSADDIYALIQSMPDEEATWIENEEERKATYRETLSKGDRVGLIRMIKALYTHEQQMRETGKRLRAADERFFKDAEKLLYDEFALVLGIEPEQVLPFIQEQMQGKDS